MPVLHFVSSAPPASSAKSKLSHLTRTPSTNTAANILLNTFERINQDFTKALSSTHSRNMAPSKHGRSKTLGAGDSRHGRKHLQNGTQACMTLLPVRDHKEPGQGTIPTHRAPNSGWSRGLNTDQSKRKNHSPQPQTEARLMMLPVRSHKEPGQTTHRTGEPERIRRPSPSTHKPLARSNSDSHALRPSKQAAVQTEARMTMMSVRPHQDTARSVPRRSEAPSKPKGFSLFGGRGATKAKTNAPLNNKTDLDTRQPVTRHKANGRGKLQANKKSLWQSLFGPKSPRSPAPTTRLNRAATIGGESHRRKGFSNGARSCDGPDNVIYEERKPRQIVDHSTRGDSRYTQAPSTTRGFSRHVDSMNLHANPGRRPLRRASTSYGDPSSTGWYVDGSDLDDGVYHLVEDDTSRDPQTIAYDSGSSHDPTMRYPHSDDGKSSTFGLFRSKSHRNGR